MDASVDPKTVTKHPGVMVSVVSLTRATDRRALVAEQFAHANVDAQFFDATDGVVTPEALSAFDDFGPWGPMEMHAKACTHSHIQALRAFLSTDESYCLMLEDDVFLSEDLGAWLADMSWWPNDADVVKIERWLDDRLIVLLAPNGATHLGRCISRLRSRHSGTAGYLVSRTGAQKIVAHDNRNVPIDHNLFNGAVSPLARKLVTYQVSPALSVQGNLPPQTKGDGGAAAPMHAPKPSPWMGKQRKALLHGWHEAKVLPKYLLLWALGRVQPSKIAWQDKASISSQNTTQGTAGPIGAAGPSN
ncbi:Lipooligosaccharide biosynthesis protein lex-1 [Thalassovita autumnalis]|uniref:Lipooligosaccharide biosynthesis protein lex-1 n=1 Tax=Thalassovita autumnalis TaxID=2072972 RepID=A0A0N7LUC7_9RHOB|nr:glycosyltransferase family 25 protein [Thalassovita autumnalis]CUH63130.1 Lipooligosaccharide biosynthesis protein lex-1 [Thalassovita autumnalis]CUH72060.1 Lipooligosaccharide biosynthesis protein lex-1 [Thalassovita autumnalis]